jgi:2-aminoadipate transaminase
VLPLRERQELLKLAARYRVPVIEDNPWQETYLDAPPPPPLYHLDTHNIVIHLSTFSKIFAPGLRIGWLVASEYIVDQLASIKQYEDVSSEGLTQLVLAELLQSGLFDDHLLALRREHARKRDIMKNALEKYVPRGMFEFNAPRGGLHLWGRLNKGMTARLLLQQALSKGVIFAPGEMFYADGGGRQELRLCFTSVSASKIEEGVKRLAETLSQGKSARTERGEYAVPLV